MLIKSARFITSSESYSNCPKPILPEYAFIGRSNVGKSSLINMLTGKKKLSKTSSTPGKTLLINHFLINENWYLVYLPGYGYIKVTKSYRSVINNTICDYISKRTNLLCTFLLIDSRHMPQKNDITFINWLGKNKIPFVMVFTKIDKIDTLKLKSNIKIYLQKMLKDWESLPQHFITSSHTGEGRDEILNFINEINFKNKL